MRGDGQAEKIAGDHSRRLESVEAAAVVSRHHLLAASEPVEH